MANSGEQRRTWILTELRRRYRVTDMLITMHSLLHEKFGRRALIVDGIIFFSSVVLVALAFMDPDLLEWLPGSTESSRITIGSIAVVTFFMSLINNRADWKGKADAHDRAAQLLSQLKFKLAGLHEDKQTIELEYLLASYEEITIAMVPIPDSNFLTLKSEHLLKLKISRILDRYPGSWVCLLQLRLRLRQNRSASIDLDDQ